MAEYLVVHLGSYPLEQLREEQGCPALACMVSAASRPAAIKLAAKKFEGFGPIGLCVALDAGEVKSETITVGGPEDKTDAQEVEVITSPGDLYPQVVTRSEEIELAPPEA